MTGVIAAPVVAPYAAGVTSAGRPNLQPLLAARDALDRRKADLAGDPRQVLELGAELLAFSRQVGPVLLPLLALMDPAARAELEAEHVQLAEDLDLLASLVDAAADSADAEELSRALAPRIGRNIEREGRLLAQAARLAQG